MTGRSGITLAVAVWLTSALTSTNAQTVNNPDSLFLAALQHQHAGELDRAAAEFRLLLNAYPDYHDARVQFGRIDAWRGKYRLAIEQFDSVLFLNPRHVEARFAKAQVLAWLRQYRQSANILQALTEENPRSVRILNELGTVYRNGGAPVKALEYYEQAYLVSPTDIEVLRGLARTHRTLRNHDLALYWYRKVQAAMPEDPEAREEIIRLTYESNHEIQISGSYESYNDSGITAHTALRAEYYLAVNAQWKPVVHVGRVSKFGQTDLRYGAGVYGSFDNAWGLFAVILVTPHASVAPDLDATIEVNAGVIDNLEIIGGYRSMLFDTLNAHVGVAGITWYLRHDTWLMIRSYAGWLPDLPVSAAGVATLTTQLTTSETLRFGGFAGYELFRATSLNEISNLRSSGGFVGLKSRLDRHMGVDLFYQYTSRNLYGTSHLVTLTISTYL